ncbi:MAG: hypothetical protein ACLFWD_08085 [Anaerolineales bacterium]
MCRHVLPPLLLVILTACGGSTSPPTTSSSSYQGTLDRVCSPVDATGAELHLSKEAGQGPPLVIIQVWSAEARSKNQRVFELSGNARDGSIHLCQSPQECELVERGYLYAEATDSLGPTRGKFWTADGRVNGRFSASRGEAGPPVCG